MSHYIKTQHTNTHLIDCINSNNALLNAENLEEPFEKKKKDHIMLEEMEEIVFR